MAKSLKEIHSFNSQSEQNNPKCELIEHCRICEYWLGNDQLHRLTTHKSYRFCVELKDWDRALANAEYSVFSIGTEKKSLSVDG